MKRFLITLSSLLFFCTLGLTQNVSINTTGAPADPSAMLDITSTDKGILVPRMATSQRAMIVNPAQGLLVYDTTTRSFWFYDGGWTELSTGGGPGGNAGGDLSGSYPSPNVVKIQNLDVAFGVPFDKQVLKWDALSNNWKGRNDSLFLPYNVTFANNGASVFGITTNSTTNGSSAIYGKRGATGSGIVPANTMGVWGDNSNGLGVVGTSNAGIGTYGLSFGNHGVYGYSTLANFAGVVGSHANANGIGVLGDIQNAGISVMGKSTGTAGKAGVFTNTNTENLDTTLLVTTAGKGTLSYFNIPNAVNNKPGVEISHAGTGAGLKVRLTKVASSANGVDAVIQGSGIAVYGKSENGVAGKFEVTNVDNNYPPLMVTNQGHGTSLYVSATGTGITGPAVDIFNTASGGGLNVASFIGKTATIVTPDPAAFLENMIVTTEGDATNAIFNSNHPNSFDPAIVLNQAGKGNGLKINLTNAANTFAGLQLTTAGNRGMEVVSAGLFGITSAATANGATALSGNTGQTANNAIGVKGSTGANTNNCIGVMGESGVNDENGIGVKGVNSSGLTTIGAVTGVNNDSGVGVFGEVTASAGFAIYGMTGQSGGNSSAARFENKFSNATPENVSIITNGKGINLFLHNTNTTNTQPQFRLIHKGTGNFMQFESDFGDITTHLTKAGNFKTLGTVTVKGDKGIVRSSTTSQLRVETVQAIYEPDGGYEVLTPQEVVDVDVTFSTPFGSAPAVYVANIVDGWNATAMLVSVINVTSSGCQLHIQNPHSQDIALFDSIWNLVAMGTE